MEEKKTEDAAASNDASEQKKPRDGPGRLSRLARLKEKIRKLKKEDPNIYPLW